MCASGSACVHVWACVCTGERENREAVREYVRVQMRVRMCASTGMSANVWISESSTDREESDRKEAD